MKNAGGHGKTTVFLVTDSQIKDESFLEDVDNLLNSGEVPNLFAADERIEIQEVRMRDNGLSIKNVWNFIHFFRIRFLS